MHTVWVRYELMGLIFVNRAAIVNIYLYGCYHIVVVQMLNTLDSIGDSIVQPQTCNQSFGNNVAVVPTVQPCVVAPFFEWLVRPGIALMIK